MDGNEIKESLVICTTSHGLEMRATILRLTRYTAVIEVYTPSLVVRASEVLQDFRITFRDRTVYLGQAVVTNLVSTGMVVTCEVALKEDSWRDVNFTPELLRNGELQKQFQSFISEWEKIYRVAPGYKAVVCDMQSYLSELSLWLDQVELGIRSSPSADRLGLEQEATETLAAPVINCVNTLFEKFEAEAEKVSGELTAAHRIYMRRQLHPIVLCSPFAYRTFKKPLGYAGDYEMVNMILRNGYEGGSLFAKVLNTWFLRQAPAQAHRNRVRYLFETIARETLRVRTEGRRAQVFSMACGPAQEVQDFFRQSPLRDSAAVTLLDFSEEALHYARSAIEAIARSQSAAISAHYVRKSAQQILKESGRTVQQSGQKQFDLVYCAGLFDYLSDPICQRLMDIMYEWVAPGGLLLTTNVEPGNPLRHGMDHLLDWHLIYRTAPELRTIAPRRAVTDETRVFSDSTGINLFLEVRKPKYA
jgi:extracellular factor (EF) 3-hydroxypalmitic acid methyl ester biosynthesis protein